MGLRFRSLGLVIALLPACVADEGALSDTDGPTTESDTEPHAEVTACGELLPDADLGICSPTQLDYQPGEEDAWPACVTDDRAYHLISDTPSSIARVEAYDDIIALLRNGSIPTPDDFTTARVIYAQDEGLESRLQRREDLHFPPVPESAWDPGVSGDKQCTVPGNVEAYPDRCVGPAKIAPILNTAFAAGQLGEGSPLILAARVDAALTWFLALSVYKEANTCFTGAAKDCDSAWAYYSGGFDRAGGIGLAAKVRAADSTAHDAILDGLSAFRCLRELVPADEDPTVSDLSTEQQGRLCAAGAQLDTALNFGLAAEIRSAISNGMQMTGDEAAANWAYVSVLAGVLGPEALRRDADVAGSLTSAVDARDGPSALASLDAVFGCP